MKIKTVEEALAATEAIRAWAETKLPKKQAHPWNGHSPEQCMILNALGGLVNVKFNLNRYVDVLRSMAGK